MRFATAISRIEFTCRRDRLATAAVPGYIFIRGAESLRNALAGSRARYTSCATPASLSLLPSLTSEQSYTTLAAGADLVEGPEVARNRTLLRCFPIGFESRTRYEPTSPQNTMSANETCPDGVMWKSFTLRARIAVEAP